MTEEIKLPNFGLAPIKMEGGIADPDEFTWECDLSKCAECNAKYVNWKRRYEEEQASIRTRGNT